MANARKIPKSFFRNNPVDKYSAANIFYFKMTVGFESELERILSERASKGIGSERLAFIEEEKKKIDALSSAEEVVAFMRKGVDAINGYHLVSKALSMQDAAIPLILRRFRTTLQDSFVEMTVEIIAKAEKHYAEQLLEMYPEIRNPYAKSMACLVFGMQHLEHAAQLLMAEYERMKKEYTEESLCQGPLLALYVLYGEA